MSSLSNFVVEKTTAENGDYCCMCGYPFDTHERILFVERFGCFCGHQCLEAFLVIEEAKQQ